jgi:hypothetical protein
MTAVGHTSLPSMLQVIGVVDRVELA